VGGGGLSEREAFAFKPFKQFKSFKTFELPETV
jgi:hypothetical protein